VIKLDYKIKRQSGGDSVDIFKPKIFPNNNKIPLLVEVSAPNSSGKTTFQQLIALSFEVKKKNTIDKNIKEKATRLLSNHQELTYEIIIDNPHFDKIVSIKKDVGNNSEILFERINRGNEKKTQRLTDIIVNKEYDLIYDIPDDPLSRLDRIVDDLISFQEFVRNGIPNISRELTNIISVIRKTPSKEDIVNLKDHIDDDKEKLKGIKSELNSLKQKYNDLKIFKDLITHYEENLNLEKTEKDKKDCISALNKLGPKPKVSLTEKNKINMKIVQQEDKLKGLLFEYYQFIESNFFGNNSKYEKEVTESYKRMIFDDFLNNEFPATCIYSFFKKVRQLTDDVKKKVSDSTDYQLVRLLRELESILGNYRDTIVEVPGFNKTPKEIIESFQKVIKEFSNIDFTIEAISLVEGRENLVRLPAQSLYDYYLDNSKILTADTGGLDKSKHILLEKKINDLKEDVQEYKKRKKVLENRLTAHGLSPNMYGSKRHKIQNKYPKWPRRLNSLNYFDAGLDIDEKKANYNRLSQKIQLKEKKLFALKNTERSEYLAYREEIQEYFDTANELESLFKRLHRYGSQLKTSDTSYDVNDESSEYFKMTEKYLAEKIGTLIHDGQHTLDRVDYINKIFYTSEGNPIYFDDLGAGQSMANYLVGMLKKNYNNPLVVLFDETAQMDRHSLDIVYKELVKLYEEKKLLCAVVVRPNDEKNIVRDLLKK